VYPYVEWRDRQTRGHDSVNNDRLRNNGELNVWLRHRRGGGRNPDGMVAGVTGFDSKARYVAMLAMVVMVAIVVVRVVMIVQDMGRRAVVMIVVVRGRSVLMFGMLVPTVRMHVRRRDRARRDGHDKRKHERPETAHEHESTTNSSEERQTPDHPSHDCAAMAAPGRQRAILPKDPLQELVAGLSASSRPLGGCRACCDGK
jgi:hypothetical protein